MLARLHHLWIFFGVVLGFSLIGHPKQGVAHSGQTLSAADDLPKQYQAVYEKLKQHRQNTPCDKAVRLVERLGNNTLRLESFLCVEGTFDGIQKVGDDLANYGQWALNKINEKPGGGSYLIQFTNLVPHSPTSVLLGYRLNFPFLKKDRHKVFNVKSSRYRRAYVLTAEGVEDPESILNYANAEMVAFRAPDREQELWLYVEGKTQLKSALVYQALPEKVLRSEAGDRLQRIAENYQDRELSLPVEPKNAKDPT